MFKISAITDTTATSNSGTRVPWLLLFYFWPTTPSPPDVLHQEHITAVSMPAKTPQKGIISFRCFAHCERTPWHFSCSRPWKTHCSGPHVVGDTMRPFRCVVGVCWWWWSAQTFPLMCSALCVFTTIEAKKQQKSAKSQTTSPKMSVCNARFGILRLLCR